MVKVSDLLRKARERIEDPKKWIKGALHRSGVIDSNGKQTWGYCMLGALESAARLTRANSNQQKQAALVVTQVINEQYPEGRGEWSIPSFNDSYKRTHEEILRVFEKAEIIAIEKDL
jgi:hypothetical protein